MEQAAKALRRGDLPGRPSAPRADHPARKGRGAQEPARRPPPPGFSRSRAKGALEVRPYGVSRPWYSPAGETLPTKMRPASAFGPAESANQRDPFPNGRNHQFVTASKSDKQAPFPFPQVKRSSC